MSTSKTRTSATDGHNTTPTKSPALLLLGTLGDTTWRMFVPTIGLLFVGDWIDRMYGTRPLLLLVGVSIGAVISAKLIRKQLKDNS